MQGFLKERKAAWIELGRSFHQMGTVNVKVCGSDFVPLWDGTVMRRSLAEHKLLEAHTSEEVNLGKGVVLLLFITLMPWIVCEQLLVAMCSFQLIKD